VMAFAASRTDIRYTLVEKCLYVIYYMDRVLVVCYHIKELKAATKCILVACTAANMWDRCRAAWTYFNCDAICYGTPPVSTSGGVINVHATNVDTTSGVYV
jgi:hypothetical protein